MVFGEVGWTPTRNRVADILCRTDDGRENYQEQNSISMIQSINDVVIIAGIDLGDTSRRTDDAVHDATVVIARLTNRKSRRCASICETSPMPMTKKARRRVPKTEPEMTASPSYARRARWGLFSGWSVDLQQIIRRWIVAIVSSRLLYVDELINVTHVTVSRDRVVQSISR